MFFRALFAFLALPGLAAFVAPPVIALFDPGQCKVFLPGLLIMAVGFTVLLWCVRDFYVSGKGTLAPWDPPKNLVIVGLYRHVRNPMYVGVLLLVMGWMFFLLSYYLAVYTILLAVGFHVWILKHEEPWLASRFGEAWFDYRAAVPRWIPNLKPWDHPKT